MVRILAALFTLLVAATALAQPAGDPPIAKPDPLVVKVDGGSVRGAAVGAVLSWKGIPYAARRSAISAGASRKPCSPGPA